MTRETPKQLQNLIELPANLVQPWSWFMELHERRQNGMGLNAISFSDMQAYFYLQNISPESDELEMLKLFDRTAVRIMNEQQEQETASAQKQPVKEKSRLDYSDE